MDKKKIKEYLKKKVSIHPLLFNLILMVLGIMLFVLFFSMTKYIIIIFGDSVNTYESIKNIQNNLNENNIPKPFPDSFIELKGDEFISTSEIRDHYFSKPFDEFVEIVKDKFVYSKIYDCKYWTYVWMTYFTYHKDEYNWKAEVIDTDNHMFMMVYNESGYCTLDQDQVNCEVLV